MVDTPQYTNLVRSFDYDVIYTRWAQSLSPGNEQRYFWGSSSADEQGSQNYAGISDPGVDALIEKIVLAPDRETLVAATHALDRVLLAMNNVVPSYTITYARTARWDRFSHLKPCGVLNRVSRCLVVGRRKGRGDRRQFTIIENDLRLAQVIKHKLWKV